MKPRTYTKKQLEDRIEELARQVNGLVQLIEGQSEDEGLWFVAETAAEAYLQQELRRLHAEVENYFKPNA